jgi:putative glutamine amidotransferase
VQTPGTAQTPDAAQNPDTAPDAGEVRSAAPRDERRPRIGIPVRLSSSADPDPRVAKANNLFGCIVGLIRDVGGEPVLLTAESLEAGPSGAPNSSAPNSSAPNSGTADGGTSDGDRAPDAPEALDGVVLPGGGDVDPRLYGEAPGPTLYDVNAEQDRLDIAVARRALDAGTPVLGICRGHQLLNVLYGGTLVQDMTPGTVPHRQIPAAANRPWVWHEVTITPGSKVAKMYAAAEFPEAGGTAPAGEGEAPAGDTDSTDVRAMEVKIASGHHQAVDRVAPGLLVTAVADDGTVEALEDPERWVASVQWHPEAMELTDEQRLAPFRVFVEACRTR